MNITKTTSLQVISREEDIRRVAITCRCGTRFVTDVPTFAYAAAERGECMVLYTCSACQQKYRSYTGRITRCTDTFDEVIGSVLQTGALHDNVVDTDNDVTIKGTWNMPASNNDN